MATYTSNLNLYMPDATDDFGEFREEHNDNMVKIDNAIGGGGNVYGAFIDPSRSLTSSIAFSNGTPINYTATEDCIVEIYNDSANALEYCVDGLAVYFLASGSYTMPLPLKKGQTLTSVSANSYSGAYHVYGLTQGTSGIFTPIIYSDNERVVGVWRDNKPLYQKSVYVGSLSAGSGVSLAHNIANIDTIANYEGIGFNTVESRWNTLPRVDDDVTYQRGLAVGATNIVIWGASNVQAMTGVTVTIWYTKTTDVAGSGNWNTDGVPTVHYSTTEQVIGTYFGKPLYQKSYSLTGGIAIGSYGHISMPSDAIIRRLEGYVYRSNHAVVDKFNGYIANGELFASIRNGDIEYWISNIFNPVEEIEFTVCYTKTTD